MDKQQPSSSKTDQTVRSGFRYFSPTVSSFKRHSRLFKRTSIFFLICFLFLSCNFSRSIILDIIHSKDYKDFPLWESKQLTINETIYIKHYYCIWTKFEFINGIEDLWGKDVGKGIYRRNIEAEKIQLSLTGLGENSSELYRIRVQVYKQGIFQERMIFQEEYTNLSKGGRSYMMKPDNPKNIAYQVSRNCFVLQPGIYRFEFNDISTNIHKFNNIKTFIAIYPT